jgi:hypothetical protein
MTWHFTDKTNVAPIIKIVLKEFVKKYPLVETECRELYDLIHVKVPKLNIENLKKSLKRSDDENIFDVTLPFMNKFLKILNSDTWFIKKNEI